MKKILAAAISCVLLFMAIPATAAIVDIAGPWIVDFPQGQAIVTLTPSGDPPTYTLFGYLPYPNDSGKCTIKGKMSTAPNFVTPGQNIYFLIESGTVHWFMLNVSSGSNGIAEVTMTAHGNADSYMRTFYHVQAPAHR